MPVRYAFITILPITSLRSTAPVFEISRFTLSNVSMNISFFRYVMPSRRQSIAPVICDVIVLSSSVCSSVAFPRRISDFISVMSLF